MASAGSTSSSGTGVAVGFSVNRPRSVRATLALVVDSARVVLVDLVALRSGSRAAAEDRVGVEEVMLAVAPPLVLAAALELGGGAAAARRPRA
jgi:hypothetical protein